MPHSNRYSSVSIANTIVSEYEEDINSSMYPQIHVNDVWRERDLEFNENGHIVLFKNETFRALLWNPNVNVEAIADTPRLQHICTKLRMAYLKECTDTVTKRGATNTIMSFILDICNNSSGTDINIDGFSCHVPYDFQHLNTTDKMNLVEFFCKLYGVYCVDNRYITSVGEMTDPDFVVGDFVDNWEVFMLKTYRILQTKTNIKAVPPKIEGEVTATEWNHKTRAPFIDQKTRLVTWYDTYGRKMQRVRDKTWLVSPMDAEYAMPHVFENTFGSIPYEMLIDPNSAESTPAKSVEVDDNGNPVDDKSSPPPAEPDDNGRDGVSWLIGSMLSGSALGAMVIYGYRKR